MGQVYRARDTRLGRDVALKMVESTITPSGGMTQTGAVLGTPRYMSPEQVRGEAVDGRTDLFSFGAVLYEMFAGRRAFPGDSAVDAGHAILHDEPAPLPPEVPLPQLVRHCLEKDPEKRFQSARDLAFNLEVLRGPTASMPAARVQSSRWRRWWWLGLPVVAVGLLWAAFHAGSSVRPEFPSIRQLTFRPGSVLSARFAPDGRTVYFSASWNGEPPRVYSTTTRSPDYHPLGVDDALLQSVSSTGELAVILHPQSRGFIDGFGTLARVPGVGGSHGKWPRTCFVQTGLRTVMSWRSFAKSTAGGGSSSRSATSFTNRRTCWRSPACLQGGTGLPSSNPTAATSSSLTVAGNERSWSNGRVPAAWRGQRGAMSCG